ncbi:MAG: mechanosensitive ion channel [Hahellaceae bacterium]|nr:mechanosensitive ion channel [Hahellaceae bacterium]
MLKMIPLFILSIFIIVLGGILAHGVGRLFFLVEKIVPNPFIGSLVIQVVQLCIVLLSLLAVFDVLGAGSAIASIAGGLGLAGLALSFATRDSIENYIASILLSIKQPFAPLDHIRIGEAEGRVISLNSRSTLLMNFEGNHIRIPNSQVYKATIVNYSRNPQRRFDFELGVHPHTDLLVAQDVAVGALRDTPGVLQSPEPSFIIRSMGDSTVMLQLLGWVNQKDVDFMKVRGEALRRVKISFDRAGIEMPNPVLAIETEAAQTGVKYRGTSSHNESGHTIRSCGQTKDARSKVR